MKKNIKIKKLKIRRDVYGGGMFWDYISNGKELEKHDHNFSATGIIAEKLNEIIDKLNKT